MAKTSLSGVSAALKILYPKGQMPEAINDQYKLHKAMAKSEDFEGESQYVAIKNANSQGVGNTIAAAQTADNDPSYKRYTLTRSKMFAVARIDGEAAEAAVKTEGALVDLVEDKVSGAAQSLTHDLAVYEYGAGNGVLARILSTSDDTTFQLYANTNMNYLELGMSLDCMNNAGLSATKQGSSRVVTGIDRLNKTITIAAADSAWDVDEYLVRTGFGATAGISTFHGLESFVEGGTSPSAIYGLTRSTDPVRLAGQTASYANQPMEDAVLDAHAKCTIQGIGSPDTLVANPIKIAAMKRSVGGKIVYDRNESTKAGVGFSGLVFETEEGAIKVLSDPYCPLETAYLLRMKDWTLHSLRKAPHMDKVDSLEYLRVMDDDSFECRWKFYGAVKLTNPGCQFRLTSFGA